MNKTYTKEEIDALFQWFEEQTNLPQSVQVNKGIYIPDLQKTLQLLREHKPVMEKNPRMIGAIVLMEKIKAICIEQKK